MREKCSGGGENICFRHERMKETKEMTAIIAAGVNPYSAVTNDERREAGEGEKMRFYVREKAYGSTIHSPEDIYGSLKDIGKADQESFWVIGYNGSNKEVFRECIALGGTDKAGVDMKILFKRILTHGASAFCVAHNHPSESIEPSKEDIEVTRKIDLASKVLDLLFLDHLIIGESGYYSFKANGHL